VVSASVEGGPAGRAPGFVIPSGSFPGPLDLESTLASGQVFTWDQAPDGCWEGVVEGRAIRVGQRADGLLVESKLSEASVRRYFRLDDDLEAIYRSFPPDPPLKAAVRRYRGLRLLRQDPWECALSFVLATFCNVPRIRRMARALSLEYGETVEGRPYLPSPERLASATEARLRELGLGYRAPNVLDLARRVAEGHLALGALRGRPYDEVVATLMEVRGIGRKVADCIALFSLEHMEAVPVDVWVERILKLRAPDLRSYPELAGFARSWLGPFAGYAQQYLYHQARMGAAEPCRGA